MSGAGRALLAGVACLGFWAAFAGRAAAQETAPNLFRNAGFEEGTAGWGGSTSTGTVAKFEVTQDDAAEGGHSALVTIGAVSGYGYQFGQRVPGGQKGKTYTFAVFLKAVGDPVPLGLEIERAGGDYGRAVRTNMALVTADRWTELHTTFAVQQDFFEGWFAYVSCSQPESKFRADAFRLYEGEYVPHEAQAAAPARPPQPQAPAATAQPQAAASAAQAPAPGAAGPVPQDLIENPGFEAGAAGWSSITPAGTTANVVVIDQQAAEGRNCALVSLEAVTGPGVRFGQWVAGLRKGQTYTLAVFARSLGGQVPVQVAVEQPGRRGDSVSKSQPVSLAEGEWTELHTTFTPAEDAAGGWFACVSCARPYAHFLVDGFRLYEGQYVAQAPGASQPGQPAQAPVSAAGRTQVKESVPQAVASQPPAAAQPKAPSTQPAPTASGMPQNMFKNAGFEGGTEGWGTSTCPGTVAKFEVTSGDAAEGDKSALVTVSDAAGWGYQFGQRAPGGRQGKTYTFAVLAKAVGGPAVVALEVERAGGDYARSGRTGPMMLTEDRWTELHTTFTANQDILEGWFAYVSCAQPNAKFRVNAFRLYEGDYIPNPAIAAKATEAGARSAAPRNLFANPGFEMGTAAWTASKEGNSEVAFTVTEGDAAEGSKSALLTLGTVTGWGCQFGQQVPGGQKGKTYTFAAKARAEGDPVTVALEVERAGRPWDRAGNTGPTLLQPGKWTEIHTTFTTATDFPEGWFAYMSCSQSGAKFRVDAVRFYEGEYAVEQQASQGQLKAAPIEDVAAEPAGPALAALSPAVRLFDTGQPLASQLSPDAPAHLNQWKAVAEGDVGHQFAGDAVFLNNRLAVALRKGTAGAELYSIRPDGLKLRAVLSPATSGGAVKLSAVKLRANSPNAVAAELGFQAPDGAQLTLGCELKASQLFVKADPGPGVTALRVEAPCRFGALPDFFADDIVFDATAVGAERVELPSENFFMHMLPDRNAMVMAVWTPRGKDLAVQLSGAGAQRVIRASEIPYGEKGTAYVAVLEGNRLWHVQGVASSDGGRVIRLGWQAPFVAHWRVDWTRDDLLTDSWDMAIGRKGSGGYTKPSFTGSQDGLPPDRNRWTTVLGTFQYPCWIDADGQAYLQPLPNIIRFVGPALIYPVSRVRETPLDVYTVTDVVRDTLGVGPCEYILDLEGQKATREGVATCPTRDLLDDIYGKGQQTARRAEVEKALENVVTFIKHIRSRIEHYVDVGHEVQAYLTEQKKAHPELAQPIDSLMSAAGAMDAHFAARQRVIKTPKEAEEMANQFRATLLGYEGPDALEKCKKFTAAWVEIGGNQDNLVGECRLAVKVLHQQAGLIMAQDPRMAEVSREVRCRCQEALKNPTTYEAPRH